jgi:hypothetical protein
MILLQKLALTLHQTLFSSGMTEYLCVGNDLRLAKTVKEIEETMKEAIELARISAQDYRVIVITNIQL